MIVEVLVWIVIIGLFILSFVGLLYPVIPSAFILWIGFLLYHLVINNTELNSLFWIMMGVLTVILLVADVVANSYFVKKFGGSKRSEQGAGIAVIVSSFIVPPFGILFIPPLVVLAIELFQRRSFKAAFLTSISSLIGFMSGVAAKVLIQLIMIIWFFVVILF